MSITLALIAVAVQGAVHGINKWHADYKNAEYKRECAIRDEGFKDGYRKGNNDAAKKFAEFLLVDLPVNLVNRILTLC